MGRAVPADVIGAVAPRRALRVDVRVGLAPPSARAFGGVDLGVAEALAEVAHADDVRAAQGPVDVGPGSVDGESSFFRQTFKKDLHGTLVQNLARIGVLTERVRPKLESLGIRVPAHIG